MEVFITVVVLFVWLCFVIGMLYLSRRRPGQGKTMAWSDLARRRRSAGFGDDPPALG